MVDERQRALGRDRVRIGTLRVMTPLEDAQEFVLGQCPPQQPIEVDRRVAGGLVLAEPVVSAEIVPPFDNTAVDGYAVRAADVATAAQSPVDLIVAGEIAAGAAPDLSLIHI